MTAISKVMKGVYLVAHGGFEQLQFKENIPVPDAANGEVLIKVAASGINNTDINTRIGWYSKTVKGETNQGGVSGFDEAINEDASWSGTPLKFPRVQGADVCGFIVAVGEGVNKKRIGERVLVRTMQRNKAGANPFDCITLGSEMDGGFAQYVTVKSTEALAVHCDWSDAELASIPCAYSTAEGMLHRAGVCEQDTVLITGASGGVGSAAVQLAKRRGARVVAVASTSKVDQVKQIGADQVIPRERPITDFLSNNSIDVVVDLVAGNAWSKLLEVLRNGGRYAVSGAIAGPLVELDVRTLYLKDLSFFGCTFQEEVVFENLVQYIEAGQIKPLVAQTYPLQDIVRAQQDFLSKKFVGKLVLVPPR